MPSSIIKSEWGRFNDSELKPSIKNKFIPPKRYCDISYTIGKEGEYTFKGNKITFPSEQRVKKLKRGELCYDKRKGGIGLIVGLAILIIGIITAVSLYLSDWNSIDDIKIGMYISMYMIVIGMLVSIIFYIRWRMSAKALVKMG